MYFVCRWREQSPFSKRVVTVPDATVLDWFRRGWDRPDPAGWVEGELGGDVYGLDSIFDQARKLGIPRPKTVDELRELLHQHLYVEAGDPADYIRLGEHALRVRTDDDEVDLAYYFVDDVAAASSPDRLRFLLNDTWPLPDDGAGRGTGFSPGVPVRTVGPGRAGPDTVFSVRLSWESPDTYRNLDLCGALAFPGLTLTSIASYLREAEDGVARRWPDDARLLRALVAPGENEIGPAVRRYARLPGYRPPTESIDWSSAPVERPDRSLVQLSPHLAQVARYIDEFFGFDQWFLFDTGWAAAHPDGARSLLRYAAGWDPFAG
jgi:hypothetical protein